jgi:large conductance mechanosensitive channel
MLKGFKEFILRGNVLDLAVAVIIGAAFGAVITSFVADVLTPLIAAIVGKPDFSAIVLKVNGSSIKIGNFLNTLFSLLLVGASVYFAMVAPMNAWKARRAKGEPTADPTTKICPACMESIVIAARKCKYCGEQQVGSTAPGTADL